MRKKETLRGRDVFSRLYATGRRADGELIRCLFLLENASEVKLLAGFAVPRRTCSAARRNRLRRLMREAFRQEREALFGMLSGSSCSASILFVFRGKREVPVERVKLSSVRADIATLCSVVISKLSSRSCP